MDATFIVTLFTAISGALFAFVKHRSETQADLYKSAAERVAKLEARADALDSRNDELVLQNAQLTARISVLQSENAELTRRIDVLQNKISKLSSLEDENNHLRQQLNAEMLKRQNLEQEVARLRREVGQLKQALAEAEAQQEKQ